MADIQMGNLYEANKNILANARAITREEYFSNYAELLENYFQPSVLRVNAGWYHMLLCKEESDYTVFEIVNEPYSENCAVHELYECLANRGDILSIEIQDDGAVEIWLRKENGVFAYYLFPYDIGIIKCDTVFEVKE